MLQKIPQYELWKFKLTIVNLAELLFHQSLSNLDLWRLSTSFLSASVSVGVLVRRTARWSWPPAAVSFDPTFVLLAAWTGTWPETATSPSRNHQTCPKTLMYIVHALFWHLKKVPYKSHICTIYGSPCACLVQTAQISPNCKNQYYVGLTLVEKLHMSKLLLSERFRLKNIYWGYKIIHIEINVLLFYLSEIVQNFVQTPRIFIRALKGKTKCIYKYARIKKSKDSHICF